MIYDTKEQMQDAARRALDKCETFRDIKGPEYIAEIAGTAIGILQLIADREYRPSFFDVTNGEARLKT